ncbi:hypothetical protein MKY09_04995 [Psychrobacillus sp. FSL K6-4046]|uniref:hypothetical protein n=1 Tax=Psychrobacillus sp. FSL K6-4046 TaxID=2921550 RepID=UPI00315B0DED
MIGEIFILVVLMIPLYAFFIWTYNFPEESFLWGKRWMYEEEPEVSPKVVRYMKFVSILAMIGTPIVFIRYFSNQSVFSLLLIILIGVFLAGAIIIFTRD